MQDGILFDNILIAKDENVAEYYREITWKPKFTVEKEKQKEEDEAVGSDGALTGFQKKVFDLLYKVADIPFLSAHKLKIIDVIEKGEKQPNLTIGVLISIAVVITTILLKVIFGGKKPAKVEPKSSGAAETSNKEGSSDEKEEENETEDADADADAAPRRRRREN